jgi:putative transcriptional regulator
MTKKAKPGRLTRALLETADDMRRAGTMDAATHEKITLRHLGDRAAATAEPMTGS